MSGLLLIHGAWHGPWCWESFAGRLAARGHDVRCVALRGHDRRPGRIRYRLHHYLEDVRRAAAAFPEPPVLVGHSMGGLLAQMHVDRHPAGGAVLMASLPPSGGLPVAARVAVRHPLALARANLLLSMRPLVGTPALVRALLFTADTPQEIVDGCGARLQDESYPAFLDLLACALRRRPRVCVPVLVIGAGRDALVTVRDVRRTARAHGTRAEVVPGMGHDMMLEPGWERVADRIDAWIRAIAPERRRGPLLSSAAPDPVQERSRWQSTSSPRSR